MGDKFSNKNKHNSKKLTKKEQKHQNHLKLMEGSKDRNATTTNTNVVAFNGQKDKKAA